MKTKEEILYKIETETKQVEHLEHLISQAELSIKIHQKELNAKNTCINVLKWCLNKEDEEKEKQKIFPTSNSNSTNINNYQKLL